MRTKWPLVGLVLLAIVTIVLVVLAILHVRPDAAPRTEVLAQLPAERSEPSATPTPSPTPARRLTPTPGPTPTPTPTQSPAALLPSSIENIRAVLSGSTPVRILVIGDRTGLDGSAVQAQSWVTLWAHDLAKSRRVALYRTEGDRNFDRGDVFGPGTGPAVEIFNASQQSGRLAQWSQEVGRLAPPDVDIVVVNVGHDEAEERLPGDLSALRDRLPRGAKTLVMLQNPQPGEGYVGQQNRVEAVRHWSRAQGLPAVEINRAFHADPRPLTELVTDDRVTPSSAGSELWRNTVVAALR